MQQKPEQANPVFPFMLPWTNGQIFSTPPVALQAQAWKTMLTCEAEMFNFLTHRCERSAKLVSEIQAAKQPQDAFQAFSDFMQEAATDYASEMGKLAALTTSSGPNPAKGPQKNGGGS